MPPSQEQFLKQIGGDLLDGFCNDDDEEDEEKLAEIQKKDEKAPKPTAEVMMSRNLKGGAGKNFNFAFSSDGDDDSQESPAKPAQISEEDDDKDDSDQSS